MQTNLNNSFPIAFSNELQRNTELNRFKSAKFDCSKLYSKLIQFKSRAKLFRCSKCLQGMIVSSMPPDDDSCSVLCQAFIRHCCCSLITGSSQQYIMVISTVYFPDGHHDSLAEHWMCKQHILPNFAKVVQQQIKQ